MAYQTGAGLTDITELLNQLRIFCLANGFTEHEFNQNNIAIGADPASSTTLVLSKDAIYYCFWTNHSGYSSGQWGSDGSATIYQKMATGYTPGNKPWMHPGAWGDTYDSVSNGTVLNCCGAGTVQRYFFFLDGTEVVVVFQTNTGWWRTFSFGAVNTKLTTFSGGAYTMGDYMLLGSDNAEDALLAIHHRYFDKVGATLGAELGGGSVLRADLDATPQYHHGGYIEYLGNAQTHDPTGGDCSSGQITSMSGTRYPYFFIEAAKLLRGANNYGLVSHMQPINIWVRQPGDRVMAMARLSSMMLTNVKHFAAGQEVTLGADTWVVFPTSVKTPGRVVSGLPHSWYFGHAVKKVV